MTSPTQSAMEQQQREAFDEHFGYDSPERLDVTGFTLMKIRWEAWQAAVASQASPTTAAMDLARSALREQAERIRVLENRLADLVHVAAGSVELQDWPELQDSLGKALAALNKEKP